MIDFGKGLWAWRVALENLALKVTVAELVG